MQAVAAEASAVLLRMHLRYLFQIRYSACLAVLLGGLLATDNHARAAKPTRAKQAAPARWHITETDNFRVLNYGLRPIDAAIGKNCEVLRVRLSDQWLGKSQGTWKPKCDVVLHPSDVSYDREVGTSGSSTIASALVDRRQRQVSLRRIDVRATRTDWQQAALAHELTHVVLADRFDQDVLPRWLDEGIAILADSAAKRKQHAIRAGRDLSQGAHFALAELLLLDDYPPPSRWGAFYDQSAAFVEFLVAEQGHQRLLEFIEVARRNGYDHAFQQVYAMSPVELERRWQRTLLKPLSQPSDRTVSFETSAWIPVVSGG